MTKQRPKYQQIADDLRAKEERECSEARCAAEGPWGALVEHAEVVVHSAHGSQVVRGCWCLAGVV